MPPVPPFLPGWSIILIVIICLILLVVAIGVPIGVVRAVRKKQNFKKQTTEELSSEEYFAEKDKGVHPVWGGSVRGKGLVHVQLHCS